MVVRLVSLALLLSLAACGPVALGNPPDAAGDASADAAGDAPGDVVTADGTACAPRPHSTPLVFMGRCTWTCDRAYGHCTARDEDGCESYLRTDPMNCGGCGMRCAVGQTCIDAQCR